MSPLYRANALLHTTSVLLWFVAGGFQAALGASSEVSVADFGAKANDLSDTTPAVVAAIKSCRDNGVKKLLFSPGRYDFYPALAGERYLFISNNDEGIKRIAFDLDGCRDLQIDGQGAQFVFHDFLCPFVLDHSSNIKLEHFSMDFARTFHSEGKIVSTDPEGMELDISPQFPYEVRNGVIVFTDQAQDPQNRVQTTVTSGEATFPVGSLLEYDPVKRETAFMAKDIWAPAGLAAKQLPSGHVKILYPGLVGTPGNVLVFGAARRDIPGITISDSSDVTMEGINIYHAGGMGVIAQCSHDIDLEKVNVTPTPGGGRVVSTTADATHFVNCSGTIKMQGCLFENQVDDATNIHGIYEEIIRKLGPESIQLKLMHPQQFGFDLAGPGTKLELVHAASMVTYGEAIVSKVELINKEYSVATLTAPLPPELQVGDVVANLNQMSPNVVIRNCTFRGNRARGILLGSRGKILVEDNTFHTAGSAILLEGDGRYWFEQAGVRDLTIRGNTFDNCNYGVWGDGVIAVGSGIAKDERTFSRYNRNIVVENNLFRQFDTSPIIDGYSVSGLIYRNNRREQTNAYPSLRPPEARFQVSDSDNVQIAQ